MDRSPLFSRTMRLAAIFFVPLLGLVAGLRAQEPIITADCAILFDANTGKVIYKKNENERRPVASTQKLLTALLIAESGDLSAPVTIDRADMFAAPTKLYLKAGDIYTRQQLLTALLVKSPNDAARALARDNAGSIEGFAAKMNARMARMGGTSSNFVNPNGLPADEQYSTARDMARVARAVYFNPLLRDIMRTKHCLFRYASGKTISLQNTNRVLRTYSFCNGMKTGYTDAAGHCLISSGSWNGKDVIAVVLGSNRGHVWQESASLLAYGLGIGVTQLTSLRATASPIPDDED
jgi:serine-type D-Ala-D-Ala carboxypeptidase (penicillin-binding protein 5/6)